MLSINSGKLCFLWLCSITFLVFLVSSLFLYGDVTSRDIIRLLYSKVHTNLHERNHDYMFEMTSSVNETILTDHLAKIDEPPPWIKQSPVSLTDIWAYNTSDQWHTCYKPVDCPASIQTKMPYQLNTQKHFIRDIPMILGADSLREDVYERLQKFKVPFGWKNLTYEEVEDFVSSYNDSTSSCLFTRQQQSSGCVTCAVVGNGGILQGAKQGHNIDAHDLVFRINLAITKGFEEDVGNKTSVYVFALKSLRSSMINGKPVGFTSAPENDGIVYLTFGTKEWDYKFYTSKLKSKVLPQDFVKGNVNDYRKPHYFQMGLTNKNLKMFHPDFLRYIGWSWIGTRRKKVTQIGNGYRPTTGAFAVMAAMHSCDKVDLYGFSDQPDKYTEYYYDRIYRKHINFDNHDYLSESELWDHLDRSNILSLYRRDDANNDKQHIKAHSHGNGRLKD